MRVRGLEPHRDPLGGGGTVGFEEPQGSSLQAAGPVATQALQTDMGCPARVQRGGLQDGMLGALSWQGSSLLFQ